MIGEAANNIQRVDPVFAKKNAEIPWQVMYAMRNRLSHGYEKVDNATTQNQFLTFTAQSIEYAFSVRPR